MNDLPAEKEKTEVGRVFRNLVTNQYMPNFDYINTEFKFQTVFHRSSYSYCICICGFEHEYLDYISDSGDVDEEIYQKVLESIINGECPHVNKVPQEFVKETMIYGIHITVAVGTRNALGIDKFNSPYPDIQYGNLFNLDPYMMAIIKRKQVDTSIDVMKYFTATATPVFGPVLLIQAKRSRQDGTDTVCLEDFLPVIQFCVRYKHIQLLKSYLHLDGLNMRIENDLEYTFQHKLFDIQEILLQDKDIFLSSYETTKSCCKLAIICNQPMALKQLLKYLSYHTRGKTRSQYNKIDCTIATFMLSKTCYALGRLACKEILSEYGYYRLEPSEMTISDQVQILLDLLFESNDYTKDLIIPSFKQIPNLSGYMNIGGDHKKRTCLHRYNKHIWKHNKSQILKTILDFGASVNGTDTDGKTPLTHLLSTLTYLCYHPNFRLSAELYIYENPEVALNKLAVYYGMQADEHLVYLQKNKTPVWQNLQMASEYIMDGQIHATFGHDDTDSFVFNFMSPLLIECGFPISIEAQGYLERRKENLHPTVVTYIQICLETPRSLALKCRDTLRNHHKGRKIHKFLEKSEIPEIIKDFILLKPLIIFSRSKLEDYK